MRRHVLEGKERTGHRGTQRVDGQGGVEGRRVALLDWTCDSAVGQEGGEDEDEGRD